MVLAERLIDNERLNADCIEVAHLGEMNHSSRFWALVRRTMPAMDEAKAWLNSRGRELHSYGRAG